MSIQFGQQGNATGTQSRYAYSSATTQPQNPLQTHPTHLGMGSSYSKGQHASFNQQIIQLLLQIIAQLLQQIVTPPQPSTEYRSIDGTGNNPYNPALGSTERPLQRTVGQDPSREPGGSTEANLPSAREISNTVSAQSEHTENHKGLSDMFWAWGQFLDHDITLVHTDDNELAPIAVPSGDPFFDPMGTGEATISLNRSVAHTDADGLRQHPNSITSFIDGSNVYGSDQETADALRAFEGGKLAISDGNLMPKDEEGHYLAGDERANENPGLTSMHTLWMREHNHIAEQLSAQNPEWGDEQLYQEARRLVVAEIQAITYNEFLPNLLGEDALADYQGYNPYANPEISNAFSSAAFRFGHTMLSPTLLRLDEDGQEIAEGHLSLREAFFAPDTVSEAGIDPILRGFASQTAQALDPMIIDDVRNFLFGQPGMGGFDLAALNIQRGRDHGLPSYNDSREALGLPRVNNFDDPIWQGDFGQKLAMVYDSPDQVDLWVGGLAEQHNGDSLVGETMNTIMTQQFNDLRAGDRFWYENQFSGQDLNYLNNLSLSDVIRRNTDIQHIQDDVMVASNAHLATEDDTSMAGTGTIETNPDTVKPVMSMTLAEMIDSMSFGEGNTFNMPQTPPAMLTPQQIMDLMRAIMNGDLG